MVSPLAGRVAQRTSPARLAREAASLRSFTQAEGVLMLVLGGLALLFPVMASVWVTAFVALAFLVVGIVGWINSLARSRRLRGAITFSRLVVASLSLAAGLWMVRQLSAGPTRAAAQVAALALAIGVVFLVEGIVATLVSLSHRQVKGWRWGLANGLVTLALGTLLLTMSSVGFLGAVGTLVGISFLFSGIDLLTFSAGFHPEAEGEDSEPQPETAA